MLPFETGYGRGAARPAPAVRPLFPVWAGLAAVWLLCAEGAHRVKGGDPTAPPFTAS